jgi:hypothetical protein
VAAGRFSELIRKLAAAKSPKKGLLAFQYHYREKFFLYRRLSSSRAMRILHHHCTIRALTGAVFLLKEAPA